MRLPTLIARAISALGEETTMELIRKVLRGAILPVVIFAAAALVALSSCGGSDLSGQALASEGGKDQKDFKEKKFRAKLTGFQEVPAVSTCARGRFWAAVGEDGTIRFKLTYEKLEGDVLFAHIHFGQKGVNGGISAFLCGGGGKPACPPPPATVEGTIVATDVIGPAAQGIAPGELDELIRAMRKGVTYANVHSSKFENGEIRGQIRKVDDHDGKGDDRDGKDDDRDGKDDDHDGKDDDHEKECVPDLDGKNMTPVPSPH